MQPKHFPLYAPITSDKNQPLTAVDARLFTIQEYWDIQDKTDDPVEQSDELVKLITGLTEKEFNQLKYPDLIELTDYVSEQLSKTASDYTGNDSTAAQHVFLMPVDHAGIEIAEAEVTCPSVQAVRLRDKQKTQRERSLFIISTCTRIDPDALRLLCLPDWIELNRRVSDFLQKPTSYFQKKTSTT